MCLTVAPGRADKKASSFTSSWSVLVANLLPLMTVTSFFKFRLRVQPVCWSLVKKRIPIHCARGDSYGHFSQEQSESESRERQENLGNSTGRGRFSQSRHCETSGEPGSRTSCVVQKKAAIS